MKERIKQIRKNASLTQEEFAKKICGNRNTVAQYESGRSEPSAAVFSLICREFGVSESWLRTGEGEMYISDNRDDDIQRFVDSLKIEGDSFKKRLIAALSHLDASGWEVLTQIAEDIYKEELSKESDRDKENTKEPGPHDEGFDIERAVEQYRQELLLEKKQAEESSASDIA